MLRYVHHTPKSASGRSYQPNENMCSNRTIVNNGVSFEVREGQKATSARVTTRSGSPSDNRPCFSNDNRAPSTRLRNTVSSDHLFDRRQVAGAVPNTFLKAREKDASEP